MDRERALRIIDTLYGFEDSPASEMVAEVVSEMGEKALSDEALVRLAELQSQYEAGMVSRALIAKRWSR